MLIIAVVAIGLSGTFAGAEVFDSQSIGNTADSQSLFGHVEATVLDENGNIKFYTQSDNIIVNVGLDTIMVRTFSPESAMSGGIDVTLGPMTHMQLGIGTSQGASTATGITPLLFVLTGFTSLPGLTSMSTGITDVNSTDMLARY